MFLTLLSLFNSCDNKDAILANDILLYKDTPVWDAAKAIKDKDTSRVREFFLKKPELLDYQEPKFKQSLLNWAVYANYYEGVVILADLGANPNLSRKDGTTALVNAAANLFSSKYLKKLIEKKADINYVVNTKESEIDATPLIAASWSRLESVKLLVEAGADVNYKWSMGDQWNNSSLLSAFRGGKIEIIRYLIIDAGADFKSPLTHRLNGDAIYVIDKLREMPFELDSEEYKIKMEVVAFLKKNGIDYKTAPIPERYYKLYDSLYLEKY